MPGLKKISKEQDSISTVQLYTEQIMNQNYNNFCPNSGFWYRWEIV
jgi:hypothetical protein